MDTIEILTAARAEVEKAWWQGAMYEDEPSMSGGVCALGALERAGGLTLLTAMALNRAMPVPGRISTFNDDPDTTKADVLALFDRAINIEAAKVAAPADPAHVHLQAA